VVQNLKIVESSVFIFSKLFRLTLIERKRHMYNMLFFILTFSLDECQTKSFKKMNTLLSAIIFIIKLYKSVANAPKFSLV